eukprot:4710966-Pyramimonas_sp.AAC.2
MAGPRSARRLAPPPLCSVADPRTSASTASPSARASAKGRWVTAATPSPRSKPSAAASNVWGNRNQTHTGRVVRAPLRRLPTGRLYES